MPHTTKQLPVTRCTLAHPGTYGHECGAPATHVAVKAVNGESWEGGIYYAGRCADHLDGKLWENQDNERIEPLDGHVNRLRCWVHEAT